MVYCIVENLQGPGEIQKFDAWVDEKYNGVHFGRNIGHDVIYAKLHIASLASGF